MRIQNLILDSAEAMWSDHLMFVTDRTPLDMLGYAMIDFNSDTRLSEIEYKLYEKYRQRCLDSVADHFDAIILIQPGIETKEGEKSRASLDKALVETMNAILRGLLMEDGIDLYRGIIPRKTLDLKTRVKVIVKTQEAVAKSYAGDLDISTIH